MKLNPLSDYVVVQPIESQDGVILTVASKDSKPTQGEVLEVGPGRMELGKRLEMTVKIGDRILYPKRAGLEMEVGHDKYLIMHEYEIFAVMEAVSDD